MAVERLRIFKGSTELNYSSCQLTKSNDHIVNAGNLDIEANANVGNSSVLDFKKSDGSTTVFSAKVIEKKEENVWKLRVLTNGYELQNIKVENVYENISPEDLVKDIIDNRTTNLTYASTATSGFTITRYVANSYAIDTIKDMMDLLGWQVVIDENDNVYFEPSGNTDNGVTLTHGDNFNASSWEEDRQSLFNHVKVVGGFAGFAKEETITGVGTEFTLSKKPTGTMRATVGGSEIPPEDYKVDAENKTVTFDVSKTNPTFFYSFHRPVIVENQDDASISEHEEVFKEIQAPFLDTFADARKYSNNLLSVFSTPLTKCKGSKPYLDFVLDVGEIVTVVDNIRNKNKQLVITKITYNIAQNSTSYEFGPRNFIFFDWQREVQERIKKLERRFMNEDEIIFTRLFKHNLNIELGTTVDFEYNSPQDSFILGHKTLSRLRPDLNFEADCSDNGNNGVWTGTGIDGSQYTTAGWRLSAGEFNGSDRIITVTHDSDLNLTGDLSVALSVKVASLPGAETYILNKWDGTDGYAIRINASNQVELIYSDSSVDSTIAASTGLTAGVFQHLVFVKSGTTLTVYVNGSSDNNDTGGATVGTNSNSLIIGRYSGNYFTGFLDEIRLYDGDLSSTDVSNINSKYHVDGNLVCYLSMDNPRLGLRETTRQAVT